MIFSRTRSTRLRTAQEQLELFERTLRGKQIDKEGPILPQVCEWLRTYTGQLTDVQKVGLKGLIRDAFSLSEEELFAALAGKTKEVVQYVSTLARDLEDELWKILPTNGFIGRYCKFTL